jgi:hypothetical protein
MIDRALAFRLGDYIFQLQSRIEYGGEGDE